MYKRSITVNNFYLKEIKHLAPAINEAKISNRYKIINTVDAVKELFETTINKGLLGLEEIAASYEDNKDSYEYNYVKDILYAVIDGYSDEIFEDMCLTTYCSSCFNNLYAYIFLIYAIGLTELRKGTTWRETFMLIKSMLPPAIRYEYTTTIEEHGIPEDMSYDNMLRYAIDNASLNEDDNGIFIIGGVFNRVFSIINYADIEDLIDNKNIADLNTALKGASPDTLTKIFAKIPQHQALPILEDINRMGPVPVSYVSKAMSDVLKYVMNKIEDGSIKDKYIINIMNTVSM